MVKKDYLLELYYSGKIPPDAVDELSDGKGAEHHDDEQPSDREHTESE